MTARVLTTVDHVERLIFDNPGAEAEFDDYDGHVYVMVDGVEYRAPFEIREVCS